MDIADRKQLFIDDRLLTERDGLTSQMHPAEKCPPVLLPELPSEDGRIGPYGSVARDGERLLMWYWGMERRDTQKGRKCLALATSEDGYHWDKPNLGLVERGGSKDNNVIPAMGDTVAPNPVGPAAEKWVLLRQQGWEDPVNGGLFVSFSADGIHWKSLHQRLFPFIPDTQNQVRYDSRLGRWVAYLRLWDPDRRVGRLELPSLTEPWPYNTAAKPHYIWGMEHPPVPRHELPTVFATSDQDPPDADVYTPVVVEYPWAQDVYLMFPSFYQHFPDAKHGGRWSNDGLLEIELAVSRDGIEWTRPSATPYLPLGADGEPDSKMVYMLAGLVRVGDVIHHYYGGFSVTHAEHSMTPEMHHTGVIGHAIQRLDGFVSLRADRAPGVLVTNPLTFIGKRLELNLKVRAMGHCKVALLDEAGQELQGFGLADCDRLWGDSVRRVVTWGGSDDVSALAGQPVRVKVELVNGDLYALQFQS